MVHFIIFLLLDRLSWSYCKNPTIVSRFQPYHCLPLPSLIHHFAALSLQFNFEMKTSGCYLFSWDVLYSNTTALWLSQGFCPSYLGHSGNQIHSLGSASTSFLQIYDRPQFYAFPHMSNHQKLFLSSEMPQVLQKARFVTSSVGFTKYWYPFSVRQ